MEPTDNKNELLKVSSYEVLFRKQLFEMYFRKTLRSALKNTFKDCHINN